MQEPTNQETQTLAPKYTGLDSILEKVGSQGFYQVISFIIFSLQWFCISWLLTGGDFFSLEIFLGSVQIKLFQKKSVQNLFVYNPLKHGQIYVDPNAPKIIANSFGTIYACNKTYVLTILSTLVYVGSFVGFFIFPYIADNYGRKLGLNLSWGFTCIGVIIAAFSVNIYMVGVGWFLGGFGGNPAITLSYSFINQQSLGKSRQYYSIGIQLLFALGQSVIGLIFKQFGDWRPINYMLIGFFIGTYLTQVYLLQSPKFMIKKSHEKTLIIYNTIAKRNKRSPVTMQQLQLALEDEPSQKVSNSSLIDLFKYRSLRGMTIICGFIFFTIQLVYYSTTFNLGSVKLDPYIGQLIVGLSQFFGYLSAQVFIPKIKRKLASYIGMGFSGIFCFVLISMEKSDNKALSAVFLCALRYFLSAFWAIFYVYQAELFPTKVRSLAMGWSSACGTIGSTLSPLTVRLTRQTWNISSWILPGAVAILATFSVKPLRETFNTKLEDDIQEQKISNNTRNSQITDGSSFN